MTYKGKGDLRFEQNCLKNLGFEMHATTIIKKKKYVPQPVNNHYNDR